MAFAIAARDLSIGFEDPLNRLFEDLPHLFKALALSVGSWELLSKAHPKVINLFRVPIPAKAITDSGAKRSPPCLRPSRDVLRLSMIGLRRFHWAFYAQIPSIQDFSGG